MNDNIRIELEALITEREGMVTENRIRESLGQAMAWDESMFIELADKMRALCPPEELDCKPGKVTPEKDITNFLQCSVCNKIPENTSKVAGDICRASFSTGHGIEKCQGVLRKG